MIRQLLSTLSLMLLFALLVVPVQASAEMECTHHHATIEALHHCIAHAYEMGHIANGGITQSLLAKVNVAQSALDRGQAAVAVRQLSALIHEVNALAGNQIAATHAQHMVHHAQQVIQALGG